MSIWERLESHRACPSLSIEMAMLGMFTCRVVHIWASNRVRSTIYFKLWNSCEFASEVKLGKELECKS